ncbi:MAG: hypothetical protein WDN27_04210 [Candidatus Saccharibacteria bacterium]
MTYRLASFKSIALLFGVFAIALVALNVSGSKKAFAYNAPANGGRQRTLYRCIQWGDHAGWSIPASVNSAPTFLEFMSSLVFVNGGNSYGIPQSYYNRLGASFIVETMLHGQTEAYDNGNANDTLIINAMNDWNTFTQMVNSYNQSGRIGWSTPYTFGAGTTNSEHVCTGAHGTCNDAAVYGSGNNDGSQDGHGLGFYSLGSAESGTLIVFYNSDGSNVALRRECGNLIGQISPLQSLWKLVGRTGVSTTSYNDAAANVSIAGVSNGSHPASSPLTVSPGQTMYWWNDVVNQGPLATNGFQYGVRYTLNGQPAAWCNWPSTQPYWSSTTAPTTASCPALTQNEVTPTSLLVNGNWENGATGWNASGVNFVVYPSGATNPAYEGNYYAATNAIVSGGSIYQDVPVNVIPGQTYCAGAEMANQGAGTGPASTGTFAIWLIGGSSNEVGAAYPSSLPGGSGWQLQRACVYATVPHTAIRVQYYPTYPNTTYGTTVIDSVSLTAGTAGLFPDPVQQNIEPGTDATQYVLNPCGRFRRMPETVIRSARRLLICR